MVVVFAGFAAGKLVMFQQIGFGLAWPSSSTRPGAHPAGARGMRLLGKANWYLPRWLEWLPRLNIEARSTREVPESAADAAPAAPRREHVPVTLVYGAVNRGVAINPGRPAA